MRISSLRLPGSGRGTKTWPACNQDGVDIAERNHNVREDGRLWTCSGGSNPNCSQGKEASLSEESAAIEASAQARLGKPEAPASAANSLASGVLSKDVSTRRTASPLAMDADFYDLELAVHGGPYTTKFTVGQVTIRLPLEWSLFSLAAIAISFLPWLTPLVAVVFVCLASHRFFGIYALLISLMCVVLSEVILKPLIADPRPAASACRTADGRLRYGMPSGHTLNWQALSTWLLLEVFTRGSSALIIAVTLPSALLMVLVPWARWYNGDHSAQQLLVGFILGSVMGVASFGLQEAFLRDFVQ